MKYCVSCGTPATSGARFCVGCGLAAAEPVPAATPIGVTGPPPEPARTDPPWTQPPAPGPPPPAAQHPPPAAPWPAHGEVIGWDPPETVPLAVAPAPPPPPYQPSAPARASHRGLIVLVALVAVLLAGGGAASFLLLGSSNGQHGVKASGQAGAGTTPTPSPSAPASVLPTSPPPPAPVAAATVAVAPAAVPAVAPTPAAPTTKPPEAGRAQALALNNLLDASQRARVSLSSAVSTAAGCADLNGSYATFTTAYSTRQTLQGRLAALDVTHVVASDRWLPRLQAAWQASAAVDQGYASWTQDLQSFCDVTTSTDDTFYMQADAGNATASAAKDAFLAVWNPVATHYGLPSRQRDGL